MGGSLRHFGPVNQGWLSCQGKCSCQTAWHWAGWGINRETNRVPSYRWTDETTTVIPMALTHADLVLHCDCDNAESRALIDKTPPPPFPKSLQRPGLWYALPVPEMVHPCCTEIFITFVPWAPSVKPIRRYIQGLHR